MGKFFLKLSRTGLLMILIGAAFVAFAFQDTVTSLKAPKSFDDVMETGAAAGDHVSGKIPYLLDAFASMETWTEDRSNNSRTPKKTSARYYVLPAGDDFIGLKVSSDNFSKASDLVDQTYGFFAGAGEPTVELVMDARVAVMEEDLAQLFREDLQDYYGYTDGDINAMGDLLVVEGRSFTAVRVICGIGAALFLLGLVISVLRWRKISAEFRPAEPAAGAVSGPEIE